MTSTYNEPLITSEWAKDVFAIAKNHNLICGYVSNGMATPEVIGYLKPYMQIFKVDLKCYSESNYKKLGGDLKTVLDTIKLLVAKGFWVEVVTLLIPGFNDSNKELKQIADFLVSVSPDIPWHITAYRNAYKHNAKNTPPETLLKASKIGKGAGLRYVYAGNLPGILEGIENTYCYNCNTLCVERYGFEVKKNLLAETNGKCPKCKTEIKGIWKK